MGGTTEYISVKNKKNGIFTTDLIDIMKGKFISGAIAALLLSCQILDADNYIDHRGHNVDSLERVVAAWSDDRIAQAGDGELAGLNRDWRELMLGYLQTDTDRSMSFARKALRMGLEKDWKVAVWDASKVIGQHHWHGERYDSAAFYYNIAVDAIEKMEVGAVDAAHPEGLSQFDIDNARSAMLGTMGNLYSMQDSIDLAMSYYARAGEIFKQYGWNSSIACLQYNIGETWRENGESAKADKAFEEGLTYAKEAGDSLWIAANKAGIGRVALERGRLRKAIRSLDEANQYYEAYDDQEFAALLENLDYTNQVLRLQKRQATIGMISALAALVLLIISIFAFTRMNKFKKQNSQTEKVLEETIEEISPAGADDSIKLSDREQEILKLIAEGLINKQIADKVCLSTETVRWYRKKLLTKFNATTSSGLISEAYKRGFLN